MKNSNFDTLVKQYILDCIDLDVYEETAKTAQEAAIKVLSFIDSESYDRGLSNQSRIACHIAGLPCYLNVEYRNNSILLLAVKWGFINDMDDENKNQKILDNWFNLIAAKLIQIANGYRVKNLKWSANDE